MVLLIHPTSGDCVWIRSRLGQPFKLSVNSDKLLDRQNTGEAGGNSACTPWEEPQKALVIGEDRPTSLEATVQLTPWLGFCPPPGCRPRTSWIGVGMAVAGHPPSEPDARISCIRLSSHPHLARQPWERTVRARGLQGGLVACSQSPCRPGPPTRRPRRRPPREGDTVTDMPRLDFFSFRPKCAQKVAQRDARPATSLLAILSAARPLP